VSGGDKWLIAGGGGGVKSEPEGEAVKVNSFRAIPWAGRLWLSLSPELQDAWIRAYGSGARAYAGFQSVMIRRQRFGFSYYTAVPFGEVPNWTAPDMVGEASESGDYFRVLNVPDLPSNRYAWSLSVWRLGPSGKRERVGGFSNAYFQSTAGVFNLADYYNACCGAFQKGQIYEVSAALFGADSARFGLIKAFMVLVF
jgi:hypothetical protein